MRKLILAGWICTAAAAAFAASPPHSALGVVQHADPAARTVTLAHQPVQSLNWPANSIEFSVLEPALFERLPAGREVAFEFVQQDGAWRIVNAIPLAQSSAGVAPGRHSSMPGRMGDMAAMREMCIDMMSRMELPRR